MIDTLVIGSGIAGLTSALLCAKAGQQVQVLEQAPYFGGLLMCYQRQNHFFPTGVHYIGLAEKGQLLGKMWNYLGIRERLPLKLLDTEATDILHFPGYRLGMPTSKPELLRFLSYIFPQEKAVVTQYLTHMDEVCRSQALYNLEPMRSDIFSPEDCQPISTWLKARGASDKFINAIGYLSFLHGLAPENCPVFAQMIIHDSFLHGTHRFLGGSHSLIKACVERLLSYGATLQAKAKVVQLAREIGGFKVTTAAGQEYSAKRVIYTGDIGLLPSIMMPNALRPSFIHRVEELAYTNGIFGVALTMPENCDLSSHNHYLYSDDDSSGHLSQNLLTGQIRGLFVSADGPGSAHILASMTPADVAALQQKEHGAYLAAKRNMAENILTMAQHFLPDLALGQIADTFTPLTFKRYTGVPCGSAYGVAKSVAQVRSSRFTPVSKIPGLYFAGQSIILPGIVGASISALAVASLIVGDDLVKNIAVC